MNPTAHRIRTTTQRAMIVLCAFVLVVGTLLPSDLFAIELPQHKYPRTAAFFLKTSPFSKDEINTLAKFQIVILDINTRLTNASALHELKKKNPSIVILGYTSGVEFPLHRLNDIEGGDGTWHQIGRGIQPEWYLKTAAGASVSAWPGNVLMNPGARDATGKTYAWYLADFLAYQVLDTGLFDGLFFDTVWDGIYWVSPDIDINADGIADSKDTTDRAWQDGQNILFKSLRDMRGDRYLLVGNGTLGSYGQYLNGRMFEGFPSPSEGGWMGSVQRYRAISDIGQEPHIKILNSDTNNTGNWTDWQRMRYGLATTLLMDGYYNFDYGTQVRDRLYYYDEYDLSLGNPSSAPMKNILTGNDTPINPGVWRRDYQHGVVFVNSTTQPQTIRLEEEFERINGIQDPTTNNGRIATRFNLPAESGLILMRPVESILNDPFTNGAFVRIFNNEGRSTRNGFFAYETNQRGSTIVARRDLDHNGREEIIVGETNHIDITTDGKRIAHFFPYGESFTGNIRYALGDLDQNGTDDIITIPEHNGPQHVKIFTNNGRLIREWFSSPNDTQGGGSITVGDLDGDGTREVIVGAGAGQSPLIQVYTANGSAWKGTKGWLAYAASFRKGVNVSAGDVNGDGKAEIVVGARRGGGPHIRIFSGQGKLIHPGFFAFDQDKRDGVDVLVHDVDGDGKAEIIAMSTNIFTTASLFRR